MDALYDGGLTAGAQNARVPLRGISAPAGAAITAQLHRAGRKGFAWEPPMVSGYDSTPGFRSDVSPVVVIDQIDPTQDDGVVVNVATFTINQVCPPPANGKQPHPKLP